MTGVVILHANEDAAPAQALAAKLGALGYEVATGLTPGPGLRAELMDAQAVIALWSPRSAGATDLVSAAAFAHGLGRLIHARMHNTPLPAEFSASPSVDLTGWRGDDDFSGWRNLRAALEGVSSVQFSPPSAAADFGEPVYEPPPPRRDVRPEPRRELRPAPEPEPPYDERPVFEPEHYSAYNARPYRDPAAYREPEHGNGSPVRLAIIGVVTFLVVAGVGIGGYSYIQGNQDSAAAETAWASLDKSNPAALRQFLEGRPGRYRQPAEAALESLEIEELGRARESDTIEGYQAFLAAFPDTRHSAEVSGRIAMLRERADAATAAPIEPPKDGEELTTTTTDAPADLTLPPGAEDEFQGGPIPLTPRDDEPVSTEEELRRAITGEDQRLTEEELRRQIQRGN